MPSPRRVLVVEDDDAIAELLIDTLADEGDYETMRARDGREGLQVLEGWRPDLIVLDLMMPAMDGWRFRDEQRRLGIAPDVPVLVLSASRRVADLGPDFGAAAVVAKPFDLNDLVAIVERLSRSGN